jgi:hypothetical protein
MLINCECVNDKTLSKLNLSRATYFRKKKEYYMLINTLIMPENARQLVSFFSVSNVETPKAEFLCYNIFKEQAKLFLNQLGGKIK